VIKQATTNDILEVEKLYNAVSDSNDFCKWKSGVYPALQDIEDDILNGTLYLHLTDSNISGVIVLDHVPTQNPDNGSWMIDAEDEEVLNVRRFAVHPGYSRGGIGKLLLNFADKLASEKGMKTIRLDVYEENMPAVKVYEKQGYTYIDTVDLGLGEYGLDWFKLYEKLVK